MYYSQKKTHFHIKVDKLQTKFMLFEPKNIEKKDKNNNCHPSAISHCYARKVNDQKLLWNFCDWHYHSHKKFNPHQKNYIIWVHYPR